MKIALLEIANTVLAHLAGRTTCTNLAATATPGEGDARTRFPTIVAKTTEGQIMDGPRGLQLITPCGPTPVDATPDGFLVYCPAPHILQPLVGRNPLFSRIAPTISS